MRKNDCRPVLKTHLESPCRWQQDRNCSYSQTLEEPLEIYIKKEATHFDLEWAHARFGVPMHRLIAFRDQHAR